MCAMYKRCFVSRVYSSATPGACECRRLRRAGSSLFRSFSLQQCLGLLIEIGADALGFLGLQIRGETRHTIWRQRTADHDCLPRVLLLEQPRAPQVGIDRPAMADGAV